MTSATFIPATAQSYVHRVESDYPGVRYKWFLDILRERYPDVPTPLYQKATSAIRIVDDVGLSSRSEEFDAPKGTEVSQEFVHALVRPLPPTNLRLIIIHFTRFQDLNFAYINTLGSSLSIDPSFFIMHFERSRARHDPSAYRWYGRRAPSMLPLESRHLQFCYDIQGHLTLTRLTSDSSQNNIGWFRIE